MNARLTFIPGMYTDPETICNNKRKNVMLVIHVNINKILKKPIQKIYLSVLLHACRKIQPSLIMMSSDLCREYRKTIQDSLRMKSLHCFPYHGKLHDLKLDSRKTFSR